MIPKECKRLAEVDFPIAEVSRHAAREKSIRHGHPSILHLWWARRPLASSRAVLLGLLWPDPCDPLCPTEFKAEARELLPQVQGKVGPTDEDLRKALLKFIADFANWDNAAQRTYLEVSRALVKAAHLPAPGSGRQAAYEPPLVVDPFAGGGSIPLEALRLGCEAFASDLNPVACLILKVMLEDIPRHGPKLAEELRRVGAEIKQQAEKELADLYPKDPDGATPIAYLWARTVRCESPNCGAEIPLARSFWLCKKPKRRRALRYKVVQPSGTGFQPVNPWKAPDLSVTKRNLPHMETAGATYFVTFRCRKGMEMPPVARAEVLSAIQHWDGKRIQLDAAVVMSDHAHALFRISDGSRLGEVLHSIKSFSCNQINKLLNRTGPFWLDENFDHIVRHAAEWEEKFEYIRQNPVKKGLADVPDAYPFLYPRNHRLEACATVEFEVFEPKTEKDVPQGTVTRAKATCVACGAVLPPERVRAQLSAQRGGADVVFDAKGRRTGGARMLAVVTLQPSGTGFQPVEKGRHYRLPTERDYEAVRKAQARLAAILSEWEVAQASSLRNTGKMPVPQQGLCPVPDEPTPAGGGSGAGRAFSVQRYGMLQWGDLFTARQKMALVTLARLALEQVVAGTAPEDYRDPAQFFARTCFTRALREHAGMVLRRLSGKTENTAPVLTLITQFGGGKTHTLTALYHLAKSGDKAAGFSGVSDLLTEAGLSSVPEARVAVFVGNAWDPQPGRETPWIDIARQLADDKGVEALGQAALTTPPGTEAIARVFQAAGAPVLLLFDEVLNFMNRHRGSAESFHAFIQNLTVATIGTTHGAAMISLPRSQVEMTEWDQEWQDRISKVVRRVAKDLIANDETEISEVVRRRLFQDLGSEKIRKNVAKAFGDWCFERRAQLPPEWTAVDTAATEAKAREFLQRRFESCYPFHPATLSVFQRNWPPALKESGAWPLASLRQSFLNGSLTRLVDPDAILRGKIVEFVSRGEFGLASGLGADGTYERVWFQELVAPDEVAFEAGMFLLRKVVAEALKSGASPKPTLEPKPQPSPEPIISPEPRDAHRPEPVPGIQTRIIRLTGTIPPEVWNRLGTKILPRLRSGTDLKVGVELSATVNAASAGSLASELRQILQELGLADLVRIE